MKAAPSRDADHFARLYAASSDPWQFRTSAYEDKKYTATLAALPSRRFRAALEVGCSIGELTSRLADRCHAILGLDIVAAPLVTARARCGHMSHARFCQMRVPAEWPPGQFDLIVLSEVLYFLSPKDVVFMTRRVHASLAENGVVLLVNWLGATDDPLTGDKAASLFIEGSPELNLDLQRRASDYRIDRLQRLRGNANDANRQPSRQAGGKD